MIVEVKDEYKVKNLGSFTVSDRYLYGIKLNWWQRIFYRWGYYSSKEEEET